MPNPVARKLRTLTVPARLGFFMPAEWEPQAATWLAWPHNHQTWPGLRLSRVEAAYIEIIRALLPYERVNLLIANEREWDRVLKRLGRSQERSRLIPHFIFTEDAWIRDYGPTFVKDSKNQKAYCKWTFNAWGKYPDLARDNGVFKPQNGLLPGRFFEAGFILEGGSIDVNGTGTCLTTEECLLNPNRNGFSKTQMEKKLKDFLGVSQVIWLGRGIAGDDTDGHVDDIARFVSQNTIAAAFEEDTSDENHEVLKENWERLERSRDPKGKKWNLVKLPMPGRIRAKGRRLPASYANFFIANKTVLVPVFHTKQDERAVSILQEFFPKRRIAAIPSKDLVFGLGSIHCLTQQEPE